MIAESPGYIRLPIPRTSQVRPNIVPPRSPCSPGHTPATSLNNAWMLIITPNNLGRDVLELLVRLLCTY